MPLGQLFVVAAPIGNLEDISNCALAILRGADDGGGSSQDKVCG